MVTHRRHSNPSSEAEGRMTSGPEAAVPLAVIIGAHGVTGEVRLKLFCESLDSFKQYQSYNGGALTLKSVKPDRKSTRLNSSHVKISYAVFCLKKKTNVSRTNI